METLTFKTRVCFRDWLTKNTLSNEGVWLEFSKEKPSTTLTAPEALEEALCFGWIDGQIKSVDEISYAKYFKQRAKNSNWSDKNKKLIVVLEEKMLMTDFGRVKIEEATKDGSFDAPKINGLSDEQAMKFESMLQPYDVALENFTKMSKSVRKAYASSYFFGAKTDEGKKKRFDTIIERLELNLNPMESMKK